MKETTTRSLAKTLTWRVIASVTTLSIGLVVTTVAKSMVIAVAEFFTKPVIYFIHERIWEQVEWGKDTESPLRSVVKTASWRILALFTMITIVYIVERDVTTALAFGGAETIIKTVLYFLHERGWAKVKWGFRS